MNRATFLQHTAAFGGLGVAGVAPAFPLDPFVDAARRVAAIRADPDRIVRRTVCTRPFRASGPRIEVERVGDKLVVHHYGHGGSGWSLSWGSAASALELIAKAGETSGDVAVVGCGAIGLTTAITAQRAGLRVAIYARERFPFVRSARATGTWSPDSRVALESRAPASFPAAWERMARASFAMHQSYLGVAGDPVEFTDRFVLSDLTSAQRDAKAKDSDHHGFVDYGDRIGDISENYRNIDPSRATLPEAIVRARRTSSMTFNIADYARELEREFLTAGGTIERRDFKSPSDFAGIAQRTIVNCTGYGARALWSDESIVPIRGQIAWLVPQDDVRFGLNLDGLLVLGRRDGIAVQPNPAGDDTGWNDPSEMFDEAAAQQGVLQLQRIVRRATGWANALRAV